MEDGGQIRAVVRDGEQAELSRTKELKRRRARDVLDMEVLPRPPLCHKGACLPPSTAPTAMPFRIHGSGVSVLWAYITYWANTMQLLEANPSKTLSMAKVAGKRNYR